MTSHFSSCDGMRRRDVLQIGLAGTLGFSISLSDLLQRRAIASPQQHPASGKFRDVSLIIVFLQGGPATIDIFDLKPERRPNFAAIFGRSRRAPEGFRSASTCPRSAQQGDKFSLLRSFTHNNSGHGLADHYMLTGYSPVRGVQPHPQAEQRAPVARIDHRPQAGSTRCRAPLCVGAQDAQLGRPGVSRSVGGSVRCRRRSQLARIRRSRSVAAAGRGCRSPCATARTARPRRSLPAASGAAGQRVGQNAVGIPAEGVRPDDVDGNASGLRYRRREELAP